MDCPLCSGTMNLDDPFDTEMMHTYPKRILVHLSVYDPNTRMAARRAQERARLYKGPIRLFDYVCPTNVIGWLQAEWYERMRHEL